jgi:hypothetical protein
MPNVNVKSILFVDSDYGTVSGTSEESWRMKQNLICACDKKVFMLSEFIHVSKPTIIIIL